MHRGVYVVLLALLTGFFLVPNSNAAAPVAGKTCSKLGQQQIYKSHKFICIKSSEKLVWSKSISGVPKPNQTPTPTPTVISAPAKGITIYAGGPGGTHFSAEKSFDLPSVVQNAAVGTNVKLWIYSPNNRKLKAGSSGIYYQKSGGDWKFQPANADGSCYATLTEGSYLIDVVEPNTTQFARKRYHTSVDANGVFTISKLLPNTQGFFTVTVDIFKVRVETSFIPSNQCQLLNQTGNTQGMVGFPKALGRLPSYGTVRALIIPVDFSDVIGQRPPTEEFTPMTDGTNDFFYRVSGNKVKFDFKVLKDWIRMPNKSDFFRLGVVSASNWTFLSGADQLGYEKAAISLADPLVDFSQFDVVYVLSPREVPATSIASGGASPFEFNSGGVATDDGSILNLTASAADAWLVQNITPWRWMAHETGHLFGLHDLYVAVGYPVYGAWDLMSFAWSPGAVELNAWNRYLLGWLSDSQINCLNSSNIDATGITTLIDPIERITNLTKAVVVRLSSSKLLVIESRRNEGLDKLTSDQEGTLVYTVDMTIPSIKGGWQVQRRPGSTDREFVDAALHQGDTIIVEGIRIEVLTHGPTGDTVKISKR